MHGSMLMACLGSGCVTAVPPIANIDAQVAALRALHVDQYPGVDDSFDVAQQVDSQGFAYPAMAALLGIAIHVGKEVKHRLLLIEVARAGEVQQVLCGTRVQVERLQIQPVVIQVNGAAA